MPETLPLVLGGHSFISQLGSDAPASRDEQIAVVDACLSAGVRTFNTTYLPERVALGRALGELGRSDEAEIIAWNFFVDFRSGEHVGGPRAYREGDIALILRQLGIEHLAMMVVHDVGDQTEDARQLYLAQRWQDEGLVDRLGIWHPGRERLQVFGPHNPYSFMVQPCNVSTPEAGYAFGAAKALWWETYATSPFVRGWELDIRSRGLAERQGLSLPEATRIVADLMLRFALHQPSVDRVIVAMRRPEWVAANVGSVSRGPLSADESALLNSLCQ